MSAIATESKQKEKDKGIMEGVFTDAARQFNKDMI